MRLGRADQIRHLPLRASSLSARFGGDAPVHHPHPAGTCRTVDWIFSRNNVKRGLVRGVPRQHLVRQRKTIGRYHQRDHHLPAVAAGHHGCSRVWPWESAGSIHLRSRCWSGHIAECRSGRRTASSTELDQVLTQRILVSSSTRSRQRYSRSFSATAKSLSKQLVHRAVRRTSADARQTRCRAGTSRLIASSCRTFSHGTPPRSSPSCSCQNRSRPKFPPQQSNPASSLRNCVDAARRISLICSDNALSFIGRNRTVIGKQTGT